MCKYNRQSIGYTHSQRPSSTAASRPPAYRRTTTPAALPLPAVAAAASPCGSFYCDVLARDADTGPGTQRQQCELSAITGPSRHQAARMEGAGTASSGAGVGGMGTVRIVATCRQGAASLSQQARSVVWPLCGTLTPLQAGQRCARSKQLTVHSTHSYTQLPAHTSNSAELTAHCYTHNQQHPSSTTRAAHLCSLPTRCTSHTAPSGPAPLL